MSRLSTEMRTHFAHLAQEQLARAVATCLACGYSATDIERICRDSLAGAAVARRTRSKKVEAANG